MSERDWWPPTSPNKEEESLDFWDYQAALGDVPANSAILPGTREIPQDYYKRKGVARPLQFVYHIKRKFLGRQNPHILEEAKKVGKDIIALDGRLERKILIGVGLAVAVTAGIYSIYNGYRVIYRHKTHGRR